MPKLLLRPSEATSVEKNIMAGFFSRTSVDIAKERRSMDACEAKRLVRMADEWEGTREAGYVAVEMDKFESSSLLLVLKVSLRKRRLEKNSGIKS